MSILTVLASEGYQDKELAGLQKATASRGLSLTIASMKTGECTGKFGGKTKATIALKDVDVDEYDAIALIGGPGAHALQHDEHAKRMVNIP